MRSEAILNRYVIFLVAAFQAVPKNCKESGEGKAKRARRLLNNDPEQKLNNALSEVRATERADAPRTSGCPLFAATERRDGPRTRGSLARRGCARPRMEGGLQARFRFTSVFVFRRVGREGVARCMCVLFSTPVQGSRKRSQWTAGVKNGAAHCPPPAQRQRRRHVRQCGCKRGIADAKEEEHRGDRRRGGGGAAFLAGGALAARRAPARSHPPLPLRPKEVEDSAFQSPVGAFMPIFGHEVACI